MINAIITGIFNLITNLFNTLLSPVLSVITSLFPSTQNLFSSISDFFSYAFYYTSFCRDLLLIPVAAFTLLFDYFVIKYTIRITVIAVKFALNIYNKFKI